MDVKTYDRCGSKDRIAKLFEGWNDTIIYSCLQGIMGDIFSNQQEDAAMAVLGDFVFFAGAPCEGLVRSELARNGREYRILIPQDPAWAELIEEVHGENARKFTRYAMKKEPDVFDLEKLTEAVHSCPAGYTLRMIGEEEYSVCKETPWARDLVSRFADHSMYHRLGLGVAAFYQGELVAGASSYSRYRDGIEIEIDTREDHRRKGLAYCCGAKLILEALKRELYPSWDAHNKESVALAEKLGYHFDHEYTSYEIL